MCYHTEFGRSALKGVGKNTGEPPPPQKKGGALELRSVEMGGVADGRTVGHGRQQRPRLRIASRGNDYNKSLKCTALVSTFQFVSLIVKIIVTLTNNAPTVYAAIKDLCLCWC